MQKFLVLIFGIILTQSSEISANNEIKIGALFDLNINENKQLFQYAIEKANELKLNEEEFQLIGQVAEVTYGNEYLVSRELCGLLEQGVAAIFGPDDITSATHIANTCDTKEIPYIDTRWDATSVMPIVNMYPNPESVAQMLSDVVIAAGWTSFTMLYETPKWLPRMAKLLEMYDSKGYTVTIRRLDVGLLTKDYRPVLRRVKLSSDNCIIIECSIDSLGEILKQVQQIGIMIDRYQYIITNFDAHTIDLEPFQYSGANITIARIADPSNPILKDFAEYLKKTPEKDEAEKNVENGDGDETTDEQLDGENNDEDRLHENTNDEHSEEKNEEVEIEDKPSENENEEIADEAPASESENESYESVNDIVFLKEINPETMRTQTALLYDGVILLAEVFKQLGLEQIQPTNIYCGGNLSMWENGISISNFMRNTAVDGITGTVKFDTNGRRSDIMVQLLELNTQGLTPFATWSSESGIKTMGETSVGSIDIADESLRNRTFIVLTALNPPYGMLKDSSVQLTGNDRFEGFGIDIIHELSLMLGFKYEFQLQEDGVYGSLNNATKEWNGMIRAIQDGVRNETFVLVSMSPIGSKTVLMNPTYKSVSYVHPPV